MRDYRITRDFLNAPERYLRHLFRLEDLLSEPLTVRL
jgi:hypothetical protein